MKTITLSFNTEGVGTPFLINTQYQGDNGLQNNGSNPYVIINNHNVGTYVSIQTIFSDTIPKYSIEANLGIVEKSLNYNSQQGQVVIDPDGWAPLPVDVSTAGAVTDQLQGLQEAIVAGFHLPVFALRIVIDEAGVGEGTFKVLQQGIK